MLPCRLPGLAIGVVLAALAPGCGPGTAELRAVATRGNEIVSALRVFHGAHGRYPAALAELVPAHLGEIAVTGLSGAPEFIYRPGWNDITPTAGSYELRVDIGDLGFDRFIYWPSETYPALIQGNGVERIGTWARVWE